MKISDKEWTILNVLWQYEGIELGKLYDELYPTTKWSKNTIHTYLVRMETKGIVFIDKDVNPHLYLAKLDRESYQKQENESFLKRVYNGSASDLITAFIKKDMISQEEKEKLKQLLDQMD